MFYATGALEGIAFKTHSEMLETLAHLGLPTQKLWWVCDGIEEVLKVYADKVVAHYDEARDLGDERLGVKIDYALGNTQLALGDVNADGREGGRV